MVELLSHMHLIPVVVGWIVWMKHTSGNLGELVLISSVILEGAGIEFSEECVYPG